MKGHIEEETLALLAGDDLSAGKAHDLARHLAECPACSAEVARYRAGRHEMRALRGAGIGADDFEDVSRVVLTRLRDQKAPGFHPGIFVRWGAAAAVILTAVTIGVMWRHDIPATNKTSATTVTETPSGRLTVPDKIETAHGLGASGVAEVHPESTGKAPKHSIASNRIARSAVPFAPPPVENLKAEMRPALDRVAIKLETPDPNVIIIWLASSEGKEK